MGRKKTREASYQRQLGKRRQRNRHLSRKRRTMIARKLLLHLPSKSDRVRAVRRREKMQLPQVGVVIVQQETLARTRRKTQYQQKRATLAQRRPPQLQTQSPL